MIVQLKAARLVEVLWQKRTDDISELACAAASTQMPASSTALATATYKSKLGRDIVEDYKLVKIGQSAYFTGAYLPLAYASYGHRDTKAQCIAHSNSVHIARPRISCS